MGAPQGALPRGPLWDFGVTNLVGASKLPTLRLPGATAATAATAAAAATVAPWRAATITTAATASAATAAASAPLRVEAAAKP
ncbi:hypothetical protein ACSSS7_003913 [Eimeria intestinalis]